MYIENNFAFPVHYDDAGISAPYTRETLRVLASNTICGTLLPLALERVAYTNICCCCTCVADLYMQFQMYVIRARWRHGECAADDFTPFGASKRKLKK